MYTYNNIFNNSYVYVPICTYILYITKCVIESTYVIYNFQHHAVIEKCPIIHTVTVHCSIRTYVQLGRYVCT